MNILGFIEDNLKNNGNDAIPEIQALHDVIENNPWHRNQSVFKHTQQVLKALKKYTNNELLILATLFHDIAKPKTLIYEGKHTTVCPNHEEKGRIMMDVIGPRIGLRGDELQYVKRIIEMHGLPHLLVNELVKHNALADMEGSDLPRINLKLFEKRKKIIEELIKGS